MLTTKKEDKKIGPEKFTFWFKDKNFYFDYFKKYALDFLEVDPCNSKMRNLKKLNLCCFYLKFYLFVKLCYPQNQFFAFGFFPNFQWAFQKWAKYYS